MVERFAELFVRDIVPDHLHVLVSRIGHGISEKAYRVLQGAFRLLKPNDSARNGLDFWCQGDKDQTNAETSSNHKRRCGKGSV